MAVDEVDKAGGGGMGVVGAVSAENFQMLLGPRRGVLCRSC